MNDSEPDYQLPEVGELGYIVEYLSEIPEAETDGGRIKPIGWTTLKTWADMTGIRLSPGEALAMLSLSRSYVNQYYLSESPGCPPPNVETPPDREVVAGKLESLFAMLRK